MPEPDSIDDLLRQSLRREATPALSPEFEHRLSGRLKPPTLGAKARRFLWCYALVGLVLYIGASIASGMDWRLATLSLLLPLVIVAILLRPFLWRRRSRHRIRT
jgi:hypothetical protein